MCGVFISFVKHLQFPYHIIPRHRAGIFSSLTNSRNGEESESVVWFCCVLFCFFVSLLRVKYQYKLKLVLLNRNERGNYLLENMQARFKSIVKLNSSSFNSYNVQFI